jgi:small-conductance mechanosensitive channel
MNRHHGLLAITATVLLTASVLAQSQPSSGQTSPSQSAQRGQTMSMADMIKGCQEHCQATSKTIDQLTQTIDEAKASNDPVKMRAALDQAQKPLADMKQHMSGCMNMMSMMQKMHQK